MNIEQSEYASNVLFLRPADTRYRLEDLQEISPDSDIRQEDIETFLRDGYAPEHDFEHIVIRGSLKQIKAVMEIALKQNLSLGILPGKKQIQLKRYLGLSHSELNPVELALRRKREALDVIRCNGHIVLFSATIGRGLLGSGEEGYSRLRLIRRFLSDLRRTRLLGFKFIIPDHKTIDTAACGCTVVTNHATNRIFRAIAHDDSTRDGLFSLLIAAPFSVMGYLGFMYRSLKGRISVKKLPDTFGYVRTRRITIQTGEELFIKIDGDPLSRTPADIVVEPRALSINHIPKGSRAVDTQEKFNVGKLPMGAEKEKAMRKTLPFFPYATEERFKDLFLQLRQDACTSSTYITLMVLSTMLATVGLFQDSSSVIIGAMLLAPLMAPIVSLSMGILRSDRTLYLHSAKTIVVGVTIALGASVLITQLLPSQLVTSEMSARLNPTLLDLAVAILAGMAAAYTKSYKEMLSGLAGVAIAVALVPPLAVSGVGLGRFDLVIFGQAFLLFSTNLVGIIVSAALVFRILGYSAAIKAKKSFAYVIISLALISFPLYLSYNQIVENLQTDQAWKKERFLINGKYIIVRETERYQQHKRDIIEMHVYTREALTREDMEAFKAKIKENFKKKLIIRAKFTYIF